MLWPQDSHVGCLSAAWPWPGAGGSGWLVGQEASESLWDRYGRVSCRASAQFDMCGTFWAKAFAALRVPEPDGTLMWGTVWVFLA